MAALLEIVKLNIARGLCSKHTFVRRHLSAAADIIHEPYFESAVAKLQGNDFSLTAAEKRKVSCFLVVNAVQEDDEDEDDSDLTFLDETLGDAAAESSKRQKKTNPYRSIDHIAATSNIVEPLFSRCGIIIRPHRSLMDPSTLEMLIMLRFNKDLWDAREVDQAMKRTDSSSSSTSTSTSTYTSTYTSSSSNIVALAHKPLSRIFSLAKQLDRRIYLNIFQKYI